METESGDDEILRKLAAGGTMDYSTWPLLLAAVVSRIDKIAREDFPVPRIPQPAASRAGPPAPEPRFLAPLPPSSDAAEPPSAANENEPAAGAAGSANSSAVSSQETNKENAAPARPPAEPQPSSSSSSSSPEEPRPPPSAEPDPGALPPQITAMLAEITGVLNETFHTYPPHTIQRLAELVLEPRRHYRSLPAYLHAVDRVVHVTSGSNTYPLPPAIPDMSHMSINGVVDGQRESKSPDGDAGPAAAAAAWASASGGAGAGGAPIGSDEALGGALLTPIPWLARRAASGGDAGSESGESSTLGSEGGPSPLGAAAPAGQGSSASASQSRQGRHFEPQVRTESTETIDGPNGMGSIETVSVSINGISSMSAAQQQRVITQGELIRQEQRAGVVPVSQLTRSGPVVAGSSSAGGSSTTATADAESDTTMAEGESEGDVEAEAGSDSDAPRDSASEKSDEEMPDEEEVPHARGPNIIGAADMGPQAPTSSTFSISSGGNVEVHGIDIEAAVGRKHEPQAHTVDDESAAPSDSSDDAVILTPASTDPGGAAAELDEGKAESGKDDEAREGDAKKADGERTEGAGPSDDMDTEPSSATMTPSPSPGPGKREAEDDLGDELESKRLKGSPEGDEASAGEPAGEAQPGAESQSGPETEGQKQDAELNQDDEGDVDLPDQTADAEAGGASEPAPSAEGAGADAAADTGTEEKKGEKAADEQKEDEPKPAERAD